MNQECRLYVNGDQFFFRSINDTKAAAQQYMAQKAELRIEYLFETDEHDFWAYEYENKAWVPS
jgi:hypothetical protein